jgi:hypothetical protein
MINFKKYRILFLIMAAITAVACQKNVTLELSDLEGKHIIVESRILDDGNVQWIRLTWTSSYYEVDWGRPVQGAHVEIILNDHKPFILQPHPNHKGIYYNDTITHFLNNSAAQLEIVHDSKAYKAHSRWEPVPHIDSLSFKRNPLSIVGIYNDTIYDLSVHFRPLDSPDACYLFNLYMNDSLITFRPRHRGFLCTSNTERYISSPVLKIDRSVLKSGRQLTLEMRSISREFYEFNNIFIAQTDFSGNPFAGAPPANIPTNISNGAFGFFQVSSVTRMVFDPPK